MRRPVSVLAALILITVIAGSGCFLDNTAGRTEAAAEQERLRTIERDVQRLQADVENLSAAVDQASQAQANSAASLRDAIAGIEERVNGSQQTALAALKKEIVEVDNKRIRDKDALDKKMDAIIAEFRKAIQRLGQTGEVEPVTGGATTERGIEYVVQEGDSVWSIAQKFKAQGATVAAIKQANNLGDDAVIRPGQKLFIPVREN